MLSTTHSSPGPPRSVTALQDLKHLLLALADAHPDIRFRFRLLGEMWQHNFMRVISVSENSVALREETNGRMVVLSDIKMIIQFELDGSVLSFEPNYHYEVVAI